MISVGCLRAEIDRVPTNLREALLTIVYAYREAVDDDIDPSESIRRGLADIRPGWARPIDSLSEGI